MANTGALIDVVIAELPKLIDLLKGAFTKANPTDPVPTDAEVFASLQSEEVTTLAVDNGWIAANPPDPQT